MKKLWLQANKLDIAVCQVRFCFDSVALLPPSGQKSLLQIYSCYK